MKPEGKIFDRSWRAACSVDRTNRRKVDEMIDAHYLSAWPQDCMLTLALFRGKRPLGVAVYALPPKEISERFSGETWELARLWLDKSVPKNGESFLIGRSLRYLRRHNSQVQTAVSFADPKHGHSGTIYRATNWTEHKHPSKNLFSFNLS